MLVLVSLPLVMLPVIWGSRKNFFLPFQSVLPLDPLSHPPCCLPASVVGGAFHCADVLELSVVLRLFTASTFCVLLKRIYPISGLQKYFPKNIYDFGFLHLFKNTCNVVVQME